MRQVNHQSHSSSNNNKQPKPTSSTNKIYDENQQIQIITQFRRDAATFDSIMKWIFLILSVVLSAASIFVVARFDEVNIINKSFVVSDNSESPLRHWIIVAICLMSITYGSLQVKKFRPEKDWRRWLGVVVADENDNVVKKNTSNDSDHEEVLDNEDAEMMRFFKESKRKNEQKNFTVAQKYGCLAISCGLLFIQLLFLAANKNIYPPSEKWTLHYLFYHCSSTFLAVAHSGCWPVLLGQMSSGQKEIHLMEKKKYQISQA